MTEGKQQNLIQTAEEDGQGGQESNDECEENAYVLALKRRLHHHLSPPLVRTDCGKKIPRKHMIFQVLLWIFLTPQVMTSLVL